MLSLGWLTYFSFGLISTAMAPLVGAIMMDLGFTYTQMGAITGAWQLIYIFSAQPLGLMVDRLGVHRSLLLGAIVMSVSSILRGFATDFEGLFASVALFGIGGPMVSIGTPKLISIWFKGRERGTASGINASGSSVGSMAALGLTNSVVLPLVGGWRNVLYSYGIFGLSVALIWLLLGRRDPPQNSKEAITEPLERNRRRGAIIEVLRNTSIWLIVVIGVVFFLTTHGLQNWLPRILELKGLSPVVAGYATSLMTLSGVLGSLLVPQFMYRSKHRRSITAGVLVVSGASILLVGAGGGFFLWVGILSAGFFTRALMPVLTAMLMDMPEVGPERMGMVGGLFFSVGEVGGFLGPFLMGYLKDATDSFLSGILFLATATWATTIAAAFLGSEN
jgi:cyanate permease